MEFLGPASARTRAGALGPRGRYVQLQIQLTTDELWSFACLDSLCIEVSPILADRVLGEIAVAGELLTEYQLAEVKVGERTEFVCAIDAQFNSSSKVSANPSIPCARPRGI